MFLSVSDSSFHSQSFVQHHVAETSRGYKQPTVVPLLYTHQSNRLVSVTFWLILSLGKHPLAQLISKGLRRRSLSGETEESAVWWDAYLASLPIEASPLLRFLDNVAQFLIGQLQVLRQEVRPLLGCEPLKDVQHATAVVESARCGVRERKWGRGGGSRSDAILNHCLCPVKVRWG